MHKAKGDVTTGKLTFIGTALGYAERDREYKVTTEP